MIGEREMFHYKRDIFDFFPNKSILQGFCDKINQCDADVYLVMAHKAVQLFNVLLNQNHLHADIKGKIIVVTGTNGKTSTTTIIYKILLIINSTE